MTANGFAASNVVAASVQSNNYYAADHFEITLALKADDPEALAFWSEQADIELEISFRSTAASPYVPCIRGNVDGVSIDPITGLLQAEGRDLSARLIDSVLAESFANRTASEIANALAARHGLIPEVRPTSRIVGRFYQGQHNAFLLDSFSGRSTEWDFLALLAEMESYDLYVIGSTLYFHPAETTYATTFVYRPCDLIRLCLDRSMTLSGGVRVTVKSWDSHQQAAVIETAERSAPGASQNQARQVIVRPNLTSDSALQLARRTLAGLVRHERTIEMMMPGELELTPRSIVRLVQTGTAFDQFYQVDAIERRFSLRSGFVQHVRASACQPPA